MQRTDQSAEALEAKTETRAAWVTPSVSRMKAGMAELGFTNTVDDGPASKS